LFTIEVIILSMLCATWCN